MTLKESMDCNLVVKDSDPIVKMELAVVYLSNRPYEKKKGGAMVDFIMGAARFFNGRDDGMVERALSHFAIVFTRASGNTVRVERECGGLRVEEGGVINTGEKVGFEWNGACPRDVVTKFFDDTHARPYCFVGNNCKHTAHQLWHAVLNFGSNDEKWRVFEDWCSEAERSLLL